MDHTIIPSAHPDPWLDMLRPYVAGTARALAAAGYRVEGSWLDPRDPRDATIALAADGGQPTALVWDEETGWRRGVFLDGEQGRRTRLAHLEYLGGKLLPEPSAVPYLGVRGSRTVRFRHHRDVRDGLDDFLGGLAVTARG